MYRLIDEQLKRLQTSHPRETIVSRWNGLVNDGLTPVLQSYLVLSGGLGSSPYVRKCLKGRYESGAGGFFPNAQDMKVLIAEEP